MSRPSIHTLDTWGRHQSLVLEVFQCALLLLESEADLPENEDELNHKLLFHVRKENHRLLDEGRGSHSPVYYESRNQPVEEDGKRTGREFKRPDFMWGFVDAQAKADLFFVVECKRLGHPQRRTWVFNQNYTTKGVRRFMDPKSGYGEGAPSGAMIGYMQTMSPDDILKEVNDHAEEIAVPAIDRETSRWIDRGVTRLNQTLDRKATPSPFKLRHLWVDLRHRYETTPP